MRSLAIAALVLLAATCTIPLASAEPVPPGPCAEKHITEDVYTNTRCGVTVEVALMSCPLAGSWKDNWVGNNNLRVYTCDRPDPA